MATKTDSDARVRAFVTIAVVSVFCYRALVSPDMKEALINACFLALGFWLRSPVVSNPRRESDAINNPQLPTPDVSGAVLPVLDGVRNPGTDKAKDV